MAQTKDLFKSEPRIKSHHQHRGEHEGCQDYFRQEFIPESNTGRIHDQENYNPDRNPDRLPQQFNKKPNGFLIVFETSRGWGNKIAKDLDPFRPLP
jgi:hypothetical protein